LPYTRFPSVRLRPLGHLSGKFRNLDDRPAMPRVQEGAAPPVGYREFRLGDTRGLHIRSIPPRRFSLLTDQSGPTL